MKIKNILALGLIAIVSGISTAQTYNATAGTNGTTEIQSDYSVATGDGASVSVDVPLEFELPKKVAISVVDESGAYSSNAIFAGATSSHRSVGVSKLAYTYDGAVHSHPSVAAVPATLGGINWQFVLYANTDVTLETTGSRLVFVHESDPSSEIETGWYNGGFYNVNGSSQHILFSSHATPGTTTASTTNVSINDLALYNNNLIGSFSYKFDMNTIEPTDRAGKYLATQTLTVTTL